MRTLVRIAGGMGRPERRPGMTLAERSARSGIGTVGEPVERQPSARHCWVTDPSAPAGPPLAGIVVAWRREPAGWSAWTMYVAQDDGGRPVVVQAWVPAEQLRPVRG